MNAWRTRRGCLSRRRFVRTRVLNEKSRFSARIGRDARDALYIAAWKLSFQLKRFRERIPMNLRFYASNDKHQLRSVEFMSRNIPRFESFRTFYRTACFRNERTRDSNLYEWKLSQTRFKRRPRIVERSSFHRLSDKLSDASCFERSSVHESFEKSNKEMTQELFHQPADRCEKIIKVEQSLSF